MRRFDWYDKVRVVELIVLAGIAVFGEVVSVRMFLEQLNDPRSPMPWVGVIAIIGLLIAFVMVVLILRELWHGYLDEEDG